MPVRIAIGPGEDVMTNIDRWLCLSCAACLVATAAGAFAGSLGGPLELQDEGSFFVNGQLTTSSHPGTPVTGTAQPGQITVNQMYVQYRIPKASNGIPIVMVHGSGHTGATYETTPDGREGWATYFARKNFPVYVVDHAGRGRSGFDPTPVNRARAESTAAGLPDIQIAPRERAWWFFRIGATYPTAFPGSQFPVEAFDQYTAQLVPNAEATLAGGGTNTVQALVALLDKIGPAIVMVHSQSGSYGMDLVRGTAAKVRAFINVEGNCVPAPADDIAKSFSKVPMLSVWGDNSQGAPGPNGDQRRNGCVATINAIKAAGGSAKLLLLPEAGQMGNSHMLMMDKNNLAIADLVIAWIGENSATR
jgi:pimeloyl-ACP methyl ester carboxylesterase